MAIFNFLNKTKKNETLDHGTIPEDLFIAKPFMSEAINPELEKSNSNTENTGTIESSDKNITESKANPKITTVEGLYLYLQNDWEEEGFSDALANPDDSYRLDNLEFLTIDFDLKVDQLLLHYSDKLNEIEFHILSRSKAGLVDLVDELKQHSVKLKSHVDQLNKFKQEITQNTGALKRILLSYNKGFMRGLSAITVSKFLNNNV
jgi:hypothetical protein